LPAFSSTTLPRLDHDQLLTYFGDDAAGRRRYQALSALLHQGKTQREAAELAQVSERTVRNTLRTFSRRGVAGLRSSGSSARRRTNTRKAFEQALRSALRAEPDTGGDRLWKRAQELLGVDGPTLSRRTAYRILADLRTSDDEGEQEADDLIGKLRNALPLLPEDPPLALGNSPLAQLLLPGDGDAHARGLLLQTALRAAIDRLRPDGPISTVDRDWWPYLIVSGEYEAGQRRSELQQNLSLSASTYSRAKRVGLSRIIGWLPALIAQASVRPAPQRLPRTAEFVGRGEEQALYSAQLLSSGVTMIWGLAGAGKTALAAEIAAEGRRYGQRVIWHSCQGSAEATLDGILRGFGRALASYGDETLNQALEHMSVERDLISLITLLSQQLRGQPSLVVLDDIHRCATDADVMVLLYELRALAARRATRLLLVGRERLSWVNCPPLGGLNPAELVALWESICGPQLPPERWDEIVRATAGLPGLLPLVAHHADEYGLRGSWREELESWSRVELWERIDAEDSRVLAVLLADSRPLAVGEPDVFEALESTAERFALLEDRALVLRCEACVLPQPALRLATPPEVSLGHWERLQMLHDARADEQAEWTVPEAVLAVVPLPAAPPLAEAVQLPAELLVKVAEALNSCARPCSATPSTDHLLHLAEQVAAYVG
jgi:transposase